MTILTRESIRLVRVKEAAFLKYGDEKQERTLSGTPYLQPWAGFSLRDGRRRFWPRADVDIWCNVWEGNRGEYFYSLLNDPRKEVREGVREQLTNLKRLGKLPGKWHYLVED